MPKPLPPPFRKKKNSVVREFKQRKCGNYGILERNKRKCKNPAKPPSTVEKSKGERSISSSTATPNASNIQPQATLTTTTLAIPTATYATTAIPILTNATPTNSTIYLIM